MVMMVMFVIQYLDRVRQRTEIGNIQALDRFIDPLEESR